MPKISHPDRFPNRTGKKPHRHITDPISAKRSEIIRSFFFPIAMLLMVLHKMLKIHLPGEKIRDN